MGTFSVGGLATGLDTKSIIDQLVQIDSRPKQQLEWKSQLWTARRQAWTDLNAKLLSVQDRARSVLDTATWDTGGGPPSDEWVKKTAQKVRDFVSSYNAAIEFVHQKTQGESRVTNPQTLAQYVQGPVARDVRFSRVGFDLRQAVTDPVAGMPADIDMLQDIGITSRFSVGGGATNGTLAIDDAKLEAALRDDPTAVRDLLTKVGGGTGVSAEDGFVRRVSNLVSTLRVGGAVDAALQGASNQIRSIQDAIDRQDDRLERRRAHYERMFSSMEKLVGGLQAQGSWLSGQFAALSRPSG